MNQPLALTRSDQAEALLRDVAEQLRRRAFPAGAARDAFRVIRVEKPLAEMDLLSWLAAQQPASRGYWRDREGRFELAGVGKADVVTGDGQADVRRLTDELRHKLNVAGAPIRYLGGLCFQEGDGRAPEWKAFGSYRFILPRCELVRRDGGLLFACNMRVDEELEEVLAELERVVFPVASGVHPELRPDSRQDCPDEKGWQEALARVEEALQAGRYDKIVLARRSSFRFTGAVNAAELLRRLRGITQQRFHFCFQPSAHAAFIGASPESLFRREGRALRTEAIAGTRARGRTPAEDEALREELLRDDKEGREHRYVTEGIAEVLKPLCREVEQDDEPHVLLLVESQHLMTRFRAVLQDGVLDGDLLQHLHPTPAVGGSPAAAALAHIRELEPFDRGWFAAPVGWMTRDAAQFAVGIRSALVEEHRVHLYAGAGIVQGSTAENEWDEVENKVKDFRKIFGDWQGHSSAGE